MKPKLSLKGRGLQWLAQREHSRPELRRKLLRHARTEFAAQQATSSTPPSGTPSATHPPAGLDPVDPDLPDQPSAHHAQAAASPARPPHRRPAPANPPAPTAGESRPSPEDAVDAVLDWLQAHHYLSDERFVESRVHARAARYGNLRIRQELAQHGVSLSAEEAQALKASEFARAREVWRRKFGDPPVDAADRARQMRFLGGRGFSPEIIRRVLQGGGGEDDE